MRQKPTGMSTFSWYLETPALFPQKAPMTYLHGGMLTLHTTPFSFSSSGLSFDFERKQSFISKAWDISLILPSLVRWPRAECIAKEKHRTSQWPSSQICTENREILALSQSQLEDWSSIYCPPDWSFKVCLRCTPSLRCEVLCVALQRHAVQDRNQHLGCKRPLTIYWSIQAALSVVITLLEIAEDLPGAQGGELFCAESTNSVVATA